MGLSLRNIGKKITDFASRSYDQVNMLDDGRSFKTRTPTQTASVMSQTMRPVATVARTVTKPSVVKPLTTGFKRSIAGLGESASGLVDLVLPGGGSSRITDNFRNAGELYDTQIKSVNDQGVTQQHYNPWLYKAGQLGGEAVQMFATGGVANALSKAPKVAAVTTKLASRVPAITGAGKLATAGRFITRPDVASNIATNVIQGSGFRTARGIDNNVGNVALDIGVTTALAGGLPIAGKAIQSGYRKLAPVAQQAGLKAQQFTNFTDNMVNTLSDFADYKRGDYTPDAQTLNTLIRQARAVARAGGIDITSGSPVDINNRIADWIEQTNAKKFKDGFVQIGGGKDAPQVGKIPIDEGKVFYHGTGNTNVKSLKDLQAGSKVGGSSRNRVYVTENPEIAKNFGDNVVSEKLYGKHLDVRDIGVEKTPGWAQDNVVAPEFADYKTTKLLTEREKRVFENQFVRGVPNNTIIEDTPGIHKYLASKGYTTITVPRTISDVDGIKSETIIISDKAFSAPQVGKTPMYRGASKAEWESVQKNGKFGQNEKSIGDPVGKFNDDVHTVGNKQYAENYAFAGGADGVVIEYKPSANQKMRSTSLEDTTDMGKVQEARGKGLTVDDVQRVTDKNGNVIYEAQTKSPRQEYITTIELGGRTYKMNEDQLLNKLLELQAVPKDKRSLGVEDQITRLKKALSGGQATPVAQGAGYRTARGEDNSLGTVALDTAPTLGVAGAIPVAGKAIRKGGKEVAEQVAQRTNPAYRALVEARKNAQIAFDRETNPAVRRKINQHLADLNAQIRKEKGVIPKVNAYFDDGKKTVTPKAVKAVEQEIIDTTDPLGNKGIIGKIRNELGNLVDDDYEMQRMLRRIEKATGRKGLVDQWMMDTNEIKLSTTRANAKIKDDANLKDAYRGMSKKDLVAFDEYSAARRELSYDKKFKTSKPREELARIRAAGEAKYGARFDARKKSIDTLTDELEANGIISKEVADSYRANPDYVRIQRDMEDLLQINTRTSKSRSFGSTKTKQKVTGSKREVLSTAASDLSRRQELEREIQRNKAATHTIDALESAGLTTRLVNADDVQARRQAFKTMKELKPVRDAVKVEADKTAKIAKELVDRNKKLGPEVLSRMEGAAPEVRKRAVSLANDGKRAVNKPTSKRLAKAPTSADFEEAFQQYLDGDSTLVRKMYEFMGNKREIERVQNKLDGLRAQYDQIKADRKDLWLDAKRYADLSTTNKNTISRFKDGIREVYEVHPDIKKVVENVSPYQLGILGRIVSTPVRVARAGLTGMNAGFAVVNYMRDQLSSAIVSKDILATHNPVSVISGIYNATLGTLGENNSKAWKAFTEFAGDQTVYDELRNAKSSKRMLRELRLGGAGKAINMVTSPVRTVEDIISITEKATRFQNFRGMYKKALKENLTEAEAYQKAYLAAAQNSVDFNRSSNFTRTMNLFFPYFNAGVQGSRTMTRAFRERPMETSMKSLAFVGIPSMAAVANNYSSEENRKAYESISQFEKDNNFIIIMDPKQKDDGSWEGVLKIPKPQGFREITQPLQDVTEAFFSKQPNDESGWQIAQSILQGLTGPVQIGSLGQLKGSFTPQQVKPFWQQGENEDFYSGQDIVPEYMKRDSDNPADWQYEGSSGSAKAIGGLINRSPIQVEKFIQDVFGSTGPNLVNAADNALAKAGVINEEDIGGRSVFGEVSRRMFNAKGELLDENKTSGQKYYETVDKVMSEAGLNENEKNAWGTLHPAKKNFMGEEIFDENKRLSAYTRASIYLQYPKVFIADARIDALQRAQGKPGNPIYDLPQEQLTRVLLKATLPPGAKDPELSNLYQQEWYQDYNTKRDAYYQAIKADMAKEGKTMPASTNPYPEAPQDLQKAMDQYSALPKGTGQRSAWISANPGLWQQMTNHWSAVDAWENKERVSMGLSPIDNTQSSTTGGYGYGNKDSTYGTSNSMRYAVSLNAGGSIAKPKISVKGGSTSTKKKYSVAKPKVSIKKSMV